jgi:hypothetical protein
MSKTVVAVDSLHEEVIRLRIANTTRPRLVAAVYDGVREQFPDIAQLDAYDRALAISKHVPVDITNTHPTYTHKGQ